jgi:hypothetical protein
LFIFLVGVFVCMGVYGARAREKTRNSRNGLKAGDARLCEDFRERKLFFAACFRRSLFRTSVRDGRFIIPLICMLIDPLLLV